jgi:hypothetical protein
LGVKGNDGDQPSERLVLDILSRFETRFNLIAKELLLERKARLELEQKVVEQEMIVDHLIQELIKIKPEVVDI